MSETLQENISELPRITWDSTIVGGGTTAGEKWEHEELVIGTYNGKPLYQRTFEITTPASASAWAIVADIRNLNIDRILEMTGSVVGAGVFQFALPTYFHTSSYFATAIYENGYLKIKVGHSAYTSKKGTLRITYTKTTD